MSLRPRDVADAPPYRVPRAGAPTDLRLDANEGPVPDPCLLDALSGEGLRSYPSAADLEARIAAGLGVQPERVLVAAGADDALDRACRAMLERGLEAIMPTPGFSAMLRWIELSGATRVDLDWSDGPYPTESALAAVTGRTRMIVVTTPNNPTGAVATAEDLQRLSEGAPDALLVVDLAYTEFADEDLTDAALDLPNAVVMRTLSKAWGLAGLRVGYAVGDATVIRWLRASGLPYAVSGPSLALADRALRDPAPMERFVAAVRTERARMTTALARAGARPQPSQANFVLARVDDPTWWRDGLAGLGIAVRSFPGVARLQDAVRIGCPGDAGDLARLERALVTLTAPVRLLVEAAPLGLPGEEVVRDVAAALDDRPAWVACRTPAAVDAARAARALPLAVDAPALVPRGAARSVDADALAALWTPTLEAR